MRFPLASTYQAGAPSLGASALIIFGLCWTSNVGPLCSFRDCLFHVKQFMDAAVVAALAKKNPAEAGLSSLDRGDDQAVARFSSPRCVYQYRVERGMLGKRLASSSALGLRP